MLVSKNCGAQHLQKMYSDEDEILMDLSHFQ